MRDGAFLRRGAALPLWRRRPAGGGRSSYFSSMRARREAAVVIPAPAIDEKPRSEWKRLFSPRLLLGRPGRLPACDRRDGRGLGLCRRRASDGCTTTRSAPADRPRRSVEVTLILRISYGKTPPDLLLAVAHDPTQLNCQARTWTQYRSAIFPRNQEQVDVAKRLYRTARPGADYKAAIVTRSKAGSTILPGGGLSPGLPDAHPDHPYIVYNDLPKIENLKRLFRPLPRGPLLVVQRTDRCYLGSSFRDRSTDPLLFCAISRKPTLPGITSRPAPSPPPSRRPSRRPSQ